MQVFKFGGASLKTANALKNMIEIVYGIQNDPLVVIVSAMGKSTNALEEILNKKMLCEDYGPELNSLEKYHLNICAELFPNSSDNIILSLKSIFTELK